MAAYGTNPVTDPDQLGYEITATDIATNFAGAAEEVVIDTANKRIALKVIGNLTEDGATIKAVYSKLKDAWRADTELIKYPFPMGPITDEQFEMINGWNWDKTQTSGTSSANTPQLLRTGGWQVLDTDVGPNPLEQWAGIISLGTLGTLDQVYFQQVNEAEASENFVLTNNVNQAVQILNDPNGDGSFADGFDKRSYFKMFVREWQKIYAQSEIADIGVSQMTFQAYRFPLTNATDLKVTEATESNVGTNAPYTNVDITYLRHTDDTRYSVLGTYNSGGVTYNVADVVQSANGRWYKNIVSYTSDATQPEANATNWEAYEGERQIGANWYAFDIVIDADNTVGAGVSGAARTTEIYERIQYELRLNSDIDDDATATVTGKTADSLLTFVGDNLVTASGVYIDSFNSQDTNAITFFDSLGTARTFPFVASLTINFGTNLQNDQFAKYWVFFTNDSAANTPTGKNYGTTNAIIVDDNDDVDMAGDVNPSWPTKRESVSHTFNYDGNVQRGVGSDAKDAPITVVGLGLSTGQFVSATGLIERSTANSVSLVSALERNYEVGSV